MASFDNVDARSRHASRRESVRRLFVEAAGPSEHSKEAAANAAVAIFEKLWQKISLLVGRSGANALLDRAIRQAGEAMVMHEPCSHEPHGSDLLARLRLSFAAVDEGIVIEGSITLFGLFIANLARFIGESLAESVLRDLWPEYFSERNPAS
jgi:hypothetical protein